MYDQQYGPQNESESEESDSESELESLASFTAENMKKVLKLKGRQVSHDKPRKQDKITVSKKMESFPGTKYSPVLGTNQSNLNFVIDKGPNLNVDTETDEESDSELDLESLASLTAENMKKVLKGNNQSNLNFVIDKGSNLNLNTQTETFIVEDASNSEYSDLELDSPSRKVENKLLDKIQKQNHLKMFKKTVSRSSTVTSTNLDKDESNFNFVIDKSSNKPTGPNTYLGRQNTSDSESSSDSEFSNDIRSLEYNMTNSQKTRENMLVKTNPTLPRDKGTNGKKQPTSLQSGIDTSDTYVNVDSFNRPQLYNRKIENLLIKATKQDDLMKRSVITSDFEKKDTIRPYEESLRQIRKQRQKEKAKTKGKNWFHMPAPEMTESNKNDLAVLQMRRALDPKRFYKARDIRAPPKYFQMGTVIESPADFYHSRVPKKQRKKTLVDELLADADFRKYNKRKYAEIVEAKKKGRGPYKHMKRLKKKKK